MSKVITVSRELGSGGREVGLRLAKKLGIPFYDKELIAMAAEDSNISEDLFHANDEVIAGQKRINYDDYATVDPFSPVYEVPVSDQLFVIQSKIIQRLAANGPCVIIGRWLRCDRRGCFPHLYLLQLQKACGADPGA